jgi:hypothetical protein
MDPQRDAEKGTEQWGLWQHSPFHFVICDLVV